MSRKQGPHVFVFMGMRPAAIGAGRRHEYLRDTLILKEVAA